MLNIAPAGSPRDIEDIRMLFGEYSVLVAAALCFQNFDQELPRCPATMCPRKERC